METKEERTRFNADQYLSALRKVQSAEGMVKNICEDVEYNKTDVAAIIKHLEEARTKLAWLVGRCIPED